MPEVLGPLPVGRGSVVAGVLLATLARLALVVAAAVPFVAPEELARVPGALIGLVGLAMGIHLGPLASGGRLRLAAVVLGSLAMMFGVARREELASLAVPTVLASAALTGWLLVRAVRRPAWV